MSSIFDNFSQRMTKALKLMNMRCFKMIQLIKLSIKHTNYKEICVF